MSPGLVSWDRQPEQIQNLFNPAFTALLVTETVIGHNSDLDVPLLYIALPLVLQREIRRALPRDVRTSLPIWVHEHPDLVLMLPSLARIVRPFTSDAILFAANEGLLVISGDYSVRATGLPAPAAALPEDRFGEIGDCVNRARFIGRWLGRAGSTANVFSLLGMRP